MRKITRRHIKKLQQAGQNDYRDYSQNALPLIEEPLPHGLKHKLEIIKPYIAKSIDIKVREITIAGREPVAAAVIFIEGLVDTEALNFGVLRPLMLGRWNETGESEELIWSIHRLMHNSLTVGGVTTANTLATVIHYIYDSFTVLLVDGYEECLVLDLRDGAMRSIQESESEKVLRGPRESFVENLVVNISLVRRRLRDPNLAVELTTVGKRTRSEIALLYIQDIADPDIVKEVRRRIDAIDTDGILSTGHIEQFIEDRPWSPIPQIRNTERPDKVVATLLEGRVAILLSGGPFALIVPNLFIANLQGPEDYTERFWVGSITRFSRFVAFFLAISLPSIYLALISFQPELIPFQLVVTLAQGRSQVPFPAVLEVLVQEVIIQLVIESGLRLPTSVAQTVGVVGGIILGQAALSANLLSPAMVVVVAVTTLSTFALPSYSLVLATRVLRLLMILLAATLGMFGFSLGWLLILTHMTSLTSIGVPFFSPLAPTRYQDLGDALIRKPLWMMKKRSASIPHQDDQRQGVTRWEEDGSAR